MYFSVRSKYDLQEIYLLIMATCKKKTIGDVRFFANSLRETATGLSEIEFASHIIARRSCES